MKKLFEQVTDKERRKILEMYQENTNGLLEQVTRKTVSDTLTTNVKPVVKQDVPFAEKIKDKSCLSSYGFKFQKGTGTVHPITRTRDQDTYRKDNFKAGGVTYKTAVVKGEGFVQYPNMKVNLYVINGDNRTYGQCYCENGGLKVALFTPHMMTPGDYHPF